MNSIDPNSLLAKFKTKLYVEILNLDKDELEPDEFLKYTLPLDKAYEFVEWALNELDRHNIDTTLPVKYRIISTFLKFYAPLIENEEQFFQDIDKRASIIDAKADSNS